MLTPERITELFKEAEQIQDACNLCGLAQTFALRMKELLHDTHSTDKANRHLLVTLWLSKFISLNQFDTEKESKAFRLIYDNQPDESHEDTGRDNWRIDGAIEERI